MSTIQVKLIPINMPNFIRLDVEAKEQPTISVGKLTSEQAESYAETLKQSFLEHWKIKSKR